MDYWYYCLIWHEQFKEFYMDFNIYLKQICALFCLQSSLGILHAFYVYVT